MALLSSKALYERFLGTSSMPTTVIPGVYPQSQTTVATAEKNHQTMSYQSAMTVTSATTGLMHTTVYDGSGHGGGQAGLMGIYGGGGGAVGSGTMQTAMLTPSLPAAPRFVKYCRLPDTAMGDSHAWADFGQEEGGDWLIITRHMADGRVLTYPEKDFARDQICLDPSNHYLERIEHGEGHFSNVPIPPPMYLPGGEPMKRQEALAQATAQVKEERHQVYTKLQEKVQKIELLLGLKGEVKKTDDLLTALAERVQEIEDYLENRS